MYAGYHAVFDADYVDGLRYAHTVSFDYVQFDLNVPRFFLDGRNESELRGIRAAAEDLRVGISLHAPGDNISLFTDYPQIRRGVVDQFVLILRQANLLGARHLTVHPGVYPSFRKAGTETDDFTAEHAQYYHEVLYDNLQAVVESAGQAMVCVENYGMGQIAIGVLERMFAEGVPVWLTWDLAKSYGKPEVAEFFGKHRDRIREVHIHDLLPGARSHLPVGDGVLDFSAVFPLIRRADVATTIEVRPREQALATRARLAALLERDCGP
jgi:sugar phosphate isomerase/epimerase